MPATSDTTPAAILALAARRYRGPIDTEWPFRGAFYTTPLRLDVATELSPESLYHFEVLRLRRGLSQSEAVGEAMSLSICRSFARAERLRRADLRRIERDSLDDSIVDDYLDAQSRMALYRSTGV